MKNPVKEIRQDHKLTQQALASLCGVTAQVIQKVESGAFYDIPINVLKALASLTDRSSLSIADDYQEWAVGELAQVALPPLRGSYDTPESFKEFRETVCSANDIPNTIIAFATLFKIHPFVIEKYEKGRMKDTPRQLIERVNQIERLRGLRNTDRFYS